MVRIIITLIYMVSSMILLSGCPEGSGLTGDRDASLTILPVNQKFTLVKDDPKKLQMVIIADPTASMAEAQRDMYKYLPNFTQELLSTGFVFEIFCSTTSYTGATFGQISSIKSSNLSSSDQLVSALNTCINVPLDDDQKGDERGLEAARNTWSKIIENNLLDIDAVKLTMIVTNEDDCSRDLGQYPEGTYTENGCKDQNARSGASPMSDRAYADNPKAFPISRYVDFFKQNLNYQNIGKADEVDKLLKEKGHIFAPVIMPPPAAVGADAAKQCAAAKTASAQRNGTNQIMSYGMRYYQVAEGTKNKIYSLCEPLEDIFKDINVSVQKEVIVKDFILDRKPKNPQDLMIEITRQISDVDSAKSVLDNMNYENSIVPPANAWKMTKEREKTIEKQKVKSQVWTRILTHGNGFIYNEAKNQIVFDGRLYESYNDVLKINDYVPAMLDGEVDYQALNGRN